ncbi:MAG: putative toxin-antitoxin system toxin component, PIN family [Candidatus Altiarchaeota archaeon]
MIKVTLDTNVLISGTFWTGDSFRIMGLIDKNQIQCILSKDIIAEYNLVLASQEIIEKIAAKDLTLSDVSHKVVSKSIIVEPKLRLKVVKADAGDDKILECAKAGKADYLISSDKHLLALGGFEGIRIITPHEFLKIWKI